MSAGDRPWSDKDEKILRDNWGKMSTADIGKLFRTPRSKNSVVSKAHRLDLEELAGPANITEARAKKKAKPAPAAVQVPQQTAEEIAEAAEWRRLMHWESGDPALWKNRPTA